MNVLTYDACPYKGGGLNDRFVRFAWRVGARLFKSRFDLVVPLKSPSELAALIKELSGKGSTAHIQFWGHGSDGVFWIGDRSSGSNFWRSLPQALNVGIWFRTCNTVSTSKGEEFARVAQSKVAYVAGHGCVVHVWQAYLKVAAGKDWYGWELPDHKTGFPWSPRTVFALRLRLPAWAFTRKGC